MTTANDHWIFNDHCQWPLDSIQAGYNGM